MRTTGAALLVFLGAALSWTMARAWLSSSAARTTEVRPVTTPARGVQRQAPWWLDRIDQRSGARDGYYHATSTGLGVTIYVVDSGVRARHTELSGRVREGIDLVNEEPARNRAAEDCQGHGTHVAALAAGNTVGLARDAFVVPVRVVDCNGRGGPETAIEALHLVRTRAERPALVLMSLGYTDPEVGRAAHEVTRAGIAVIAAAGDDLADACSVFPCAADGVVGVGQIDEHDRQWPLGNGGPCVDLLAPGASITSAGNGDDSQMRTLTGSSQAAALVAGAAALLLERAPAMPPADVERELVRRATPEAVEMAKTLAARGTANRLLFVGNE